jgi:hypothetical protein
MTVAEPTPDADIKLATLLKEDLPAFSSNALGYFVRYRIVSKDKNRSSHWSPYYLLLKGTVQKVSCSVDVTGTAPTKVINILNSDICIFCDDLSDYKEIVEMVLLNGGIYKLEDKDHDHYLDNFKILLRTSGINMKNNSANKPTLQFISHKIYQEDNAKLQLATQLLTGENCDDAKSYLELYKQF